ncbi:hypothetical protein NHQ30_002592 [Ciborinia camelliae]|nr:hypothetical protein NHQ30_002592 [Ciborinia camelliae]
MAGTKLRKGNSATLNNKNNTNDDSMNERHHQSNENDRTSFYFPDKKAMQRKDNEIHFLRLLSLIAALVAFFIFAFHRYKVSKLEALLKTKDEECIEALTGGVVLTSEDVSVLAKMMDQFLSLIYILAIVVGVTTWCLKISEY